MHKIQENAPMATIFLYVLYMLQEFIRIFAVES